MVIMQKYLLESGLLYRFHGYGFVHVMHFSVCSKGLYKINIKSIMGSQ